MYTCRPYVQLAWHGGSLSTFPPLLPSLVQTNFTSYHYIIIIIIQMFEYSLSRVQFYCLWLSCFPFDEGPFPFPHGPLQNDC